MSDTGITRAALIIFTVVLATAIDTRLATLGITAIALLAVDQVGFQGRISSLLNALVAYRSAEYRNRILHHEAGHLLAALTLGIPVVDYVLDPWQAFLKGYPGYGGVQLDTTPLEQWFRRQQIKQSDLERYGVFWMAGGVAEANYAGDSIGDEDDRRQLNQWLSLLRKQSGSVLKVEQLAAQFSLEAAELLQQQAEAYTAIVKAMQQRASIPDCQQVVKHLSQDVEQDPEAT